MGPLERTFIKSTFDALNDFIASNLGYILSSPEIPISDTVSESKSPFTVRVPGRQPKKPSAIVDFRREGERSATVRKLVEAGEVDFFDLSGKVAAWFRDSLFWPKTYLFVTQATIKRGHNSWKLTGILATKLEYGELAEDAEKIVEQMQRGVVHKKISKAIVYPHFVAKGGRIVTEDEARSSNPNPARRTTSTNSCV